MFHLLKLTSRLHTFSLNAAVLAGLLPVMAAQASAQGGGMGSMQGMQNMPGMSGASGAAATASATGVVESIDVPKRKIKLSHGPIPAFNWPAMSMEMAAAPSIDLSKVKAGNKVNFTVSKGSEGTYTVQSLSSAQ